MKRRILAWILIVALVLIFAACTKEENPDTGNEGTEQTPGPTGDAGSTGEDGNHNDEDAAQDPDRDPVVPDISWD